MLSFNGTILLSSDLFITGTNLPSKMFSCFCSSFCSIFVNGLIPWCSQNLIKNKLSKPTERLSIPSSHLKLSIKNF